MSHIILGANGHVGSALAQALLKKGESVTVVLHDSQKAHAWEQKGAHIAVTDVHDVKALRHVFHQGQRLFLLNPPATPATDTAKEERINLFSILAALDGSGLEKVVAESTYGAQPGERIGDLGVLYEMEQALSAYPIPSSIIRAAYYMSNWDASLQTARQQGQVNTFYPLDFKLPMVAPHDIGQLAAHLMLEPLQKTGMHYIEGPEMYSSFDVAKAFASALQRPVEAVQIPRLRWEQALHEMGFSEKAAQSFMAMTNITLKTQFPTVNEPVRGSTSLQKYIDQLVKTQN